MDSGNITNQQDGGRIHFFGAASASPPAGFIPSTLVVRHSTIDGNAAAGIGGGIEMRSFNGTLLLRTVRGRERSPLPTRSSQATPAGRKAISKSDTPVTANFSAIGSSAGFTLSGSSGNNLAPGTDLKLGPLGNYDGPTQTILPLPGSPLIDAGSAALVPATMLNDQRGAGFPRILGAAPNIGAVEDQNTIRGVANLSNVNASGGTVYTFTVTYTAATAVDVATLGNGDVTVEGPGGFSTSPVLKSVTPGGNGTPRTATYEFPPRRKLEHRR